jgi:hypothetical protein
MDFTLTVGVEPSGTFATHQTSQIELTVSEFGQYGLGIGSIYNLNAEGFRVHGSDNLLYEAGIIMGTDSSHMSKSVRGSGGEYEVSDFLPTSNLSSAWTGTNNGIHRTAAFTDPALAASVPVEVKQETISYPYMDDNGMIVLKYYLKNSSVDILTDFNFGLLVDFDLGIKSEQVNIQQDLDMIYLHDSNNPMAGVVGLKNIVKLKAIDNGASKRGFTKSELYDAVSLFPDAVCGNLFSLLIQS